MAQIQLKDALEVAANTADGINASGSTPITYSDTVWEDLRVPVSSTTRGGSKDPGFQVFRKDTGGTSQGVFAYAFDQTSEEELYFAVQIPHSYKLGTDIKPHVHFGVVNAVPLKTVRWGLEYTIANINDAFGVTNTIYTDATTATVAYTHYLASFTDIDGSGIDSVSTMLLCRVFRDVANDDLGADAFLFEIDFHFEIDTPGSATATAK
jgi:hypothetical protein